jgi:hypothetical protein
MFSNQGYVIQALHQKLRLWATFLCIRDFCAKVAIRLHLMRILIIERYHSRYFRLRLAPLCLHVLGIISGSSSEVPAPVGKVFHVKVRDLKKT